MKLFQGLWQALRGLHFNYGNMNAEPSQIFRHFKPDKSAADNGRPSNFIFFNPFDNFPCIRDIPECEYSGKINSFKFRSLKELIPGKEEGRHIFHCKPFLF